MHQFTSPSGTILTAKLLADLPDEQQARDLRFDCPVCGYPNVFSFRLRPGRPPLLYCFNGCPTPALYVAVKQLSGSAWKAPKASSAAKLAAHQAKRKNLALDLFGDSAAVSGTIGETYLTSRKIGHLAKSDALGFHPEVPHPTGPRLPALIALVVDVADRPIGIHRTYLAPDGKGKASVTPQKASLGPVSGGVIPLSKLNAGLPLVIGEGLETSASAGIIFNAPAWAAISAGNLEKSLQLPSTVKEVAIAADPDPAGLRAALGAANRWARDGYSVKLVIPSGSGDFNDILRAKAEATHG